MDENLEAIIHHLREKAKNMKYEQEIIQPIHTEIVKRLDSFFEYPIQKNEVIPVEINPITGTSSFYLRGHDIIGINSLSIRLAEDIVEWDGTLCEKGSTKELQGILIHEYFHSIFHNYYSLQLKQLLDEGEEYEDALELKAGPILRATDEAFAFWGQEILNDEEIFKNADFVFYQELGCNIEVLKRSYALFKHYAKKESPSYVRNNLISLVQENRR